MKFPLHLVPFIFFIIFQFAGAQPEAPRADDVLKLDPAALPQVTDWFRDTESKVYARAEEALLKGPAALEELANSLQADEPKDKDGRYTRAIFFRAICQDGRSVKTEDRRSYQQRIFSEWRKKYPDSQLAVLAQAKLLIDLASEARDSGFGVANPDDKWKVFRNLLNEADELLERCRGLQTIDPSWTIQKILIMSDLGTPQEDFEKLTDRLFADFPDCEYAGSRAIEYMSPLRGKKGGEWQPWFFGKLKNLAPDQADRYYARNLTEIITIYGFGTEASNILGGVKIDNERLRKGLDGLALEYPDSAWLASADAALSAFMLRDREGVFKALLRAKGRIDLSIFRTEEYYKRAAGFITWKQGKVEKDFGIPYITERIEQSPADIPQRVEAAAKAGPKALEELIRHLRTEEIRDRDGMYLSTIFFGCFASESGSLKKDEERLRRQRIIEDWQKEFPESPSARLAGVYYWISYAWDSRGSGYASQVSRSQWKGFSDRLRLAHENLEACRELQELDPAWSAAAVGLLQAEGDDREKFEELAAVIFEQFPECDAAVHNCLRYLAPRWHGQKGEWEPWLKEKLKNLPVDVQARAYARAVAGLCGFWFASEKNKKEMFEPVKVDRALADGGFKSLHEKYPDSPWVANADLIVTAYAYDDDLDLLINQMKRMNGRLDMRLWLRNELYDNVMYWLLVKKNR